MDALEQLINKGFPASHVVLRIDPVIPEGDCLTPLDNILTRAENIKGLSRVRISVLDNYPHVRSRFLQTGIMPLYDGKFAAPDEELIDVLNILAKHPFRYEACAETKLCKFSRGLVKACGCISEKDLGFMGLKREEFFLNPQNRTGCKCLSCKTELLGKSHACPHGCLYCYWKRPGE